jgi:cytidyltransferase-like protein
MILTSGCFDCCHAGHVRYLLESAKWKRHGQEHLVVAVAPDAYIVNVKRREPLWTLADRRFVIAHLNMVDTLVTHGPESVASAILELKPRLFVKGADWEGHLPDDVIGACSEVGASIVYVPTRGKHNADALSAL